VREGLEAGQLDQAQINQHLTPVAVRVMVRAAHRRADTGGQARPFGQQPQRQHTGKRHTALVVPDQFQPGSP
jgi:hypothetical protein